MNNPNGVGNGWNAVIINPAPALFPFLGCNLEIISTDLTRYQGRLAAVDVENRCIKLVEVQHFGTERRILGVAGAKPAKGQLPPQEERTFYEQYIHSQRVLPAPPVVEAKMSSPPTPTVHSTAGSSYGGGGGGGGPIPVTISPGWANIAAGPSSSSSAMNGGPITMDAQQQQPQRVPAMNGFYPFSSAESATNNYGYPSSVSHPSSQASANKGPTKEGEVMWINQDGSNPHSTMNTNESVREPMLNNHTSVYIPKPGVGGHAENEGAIGNGNGRRNSSSDEHGVDDEDSDAETVRHGMIRLKRLGTADPHRRHRKRSVSRSRYDSEDSNHRSHRRERSLSRVRHGSGDSPRHHHRRHRSLSRDPAESSRRRRSLRAASPHLRRHHHDHVASFGSSFGRGGHYPRYFISQLQQHSYGRRRAVGIIINAHKFPDAPAYLAFHASDQHPVPTVMVGEVWQVPKILWAGRGRELSHHVYMPNNKYPTMDAFKKQNSNLLPWIADHRINTQAVADGRGMCLVRDSELVTKSALITRVGQTTTGTGFIQRWVEVEADGCLKARIEVGQFMRKIGGRCFEELREGSTVRIVAVRLNADCLVGPSYVLPNIDYYISKPPFTLLTGPWLKWRVEMSREGDYFPVKIIEDEDDDNNRNG